MHKLLFNVDEQVLYMFMLNFLTVYIILLDLYAYLRIQIPIFIYFKIYISSKFTNKVFCTISVWGAISKDGWVLLIYIYDKSKSTKYIYKCSESCIRVLGLHFAIIAATRHAATRHWQSSYMEKKYVEKCRPVPNLCSWPYWIHWAYIISSAISNSPRHIVFKEWTILCCPYATFTNFWI